MQSARIGGRDEFVVDFAKRVTRRIASATVVMVNGGNVARATGVMLLHEGSIFLCLFANSAATGGCSTKLVSGSCCVAGGSIPVGVVMPAPSFLANLLAQGAKVGDAGARADAACRA